MRLTEFGHDVMHQALLDLPRRFGDEECWEYAETLHQLSEGLPALLVKSVQWAEGTEASRLAIEQPRALQRLLPGVAVVGRRGRHRQPAERRPRVKSPERGADIPRWCDVNRAAGFHTAFAEALLGGA